MTAEPAAAPTPDTDPDGPTATDVLIDTGDFEVGQLRWRFRHAAGLDVRAALNATLGEYRDLLTAANDGFVPDDVSVSEALDAIDVELFAAHGLAPIHEFIDEVAFDDVQLNNLEV